MANYVLCTTDIPVLRREARCLYGRFCPFPRPIALILRIRFSFANRRNIPWYAYLHYAIHNFNFATSYSVVLQKLAKHSLPVGSRVFLPFYCVLNSGVQFSARCDSVFKVNHKIINDKHLNVIVKFNFNSFRGFPILFILNFTAETKFI